MALPRVCAEKIANGSREERGFSSALGYGAVQPGAAAELSDEI
jgi:hypothetical protein